jgi:hypothetical protein
MSWYSHFGAYTIPHFAVDLRGSDTHSSKVFHGCSRSGAFQRAISLLLGASTHNEGLRFLSGESATSLLQDGESKTKLTRISPKAAARLAHEIDELLVFCATHIDRLAELWEELGMCNTIELANAIEIGASGVDLNKESQSGDDGDSPYFTFMVLVSLRAALSQLQSKELDLVFWTWEP